jgi:anti-sigma factor RsiW
MNCKRCQKLFHEYLDENLSPRVRTSIEEHLRDCGDCRDALAEERSLSTSMRGLLNRQVEGLKLRPGVQHEVVKAIESGAPSPKIHRNYRRILLRPALAMGVAACVLVAVMAIFQNGKSPPTQPAAQHPQSYIMCMATTYADQAKTDWIERRLIVEMRNGIEGYLEIIARKPAETTQTNQEVEEQQ